MQNSSQTSSANEVKGPLSGVRIVEFGAIGPVPFACMLLADMGADILRLDRHGSDPANPDAVIKRGRRMAPVDLKNPGEIEQTLDLLDKADVLLEGFRPGVMEKLGLGPEVVLARNPRLVYGRMTGWGQTGPLAQTAGHDINYISISGALAAMGDAEKPMIPLNLVGDYGGGAMFLVMGVLAAVLNARATGRGQVVDSAMCDGAAVLMSPFYEMHAKGLWQDQRAANFVDGGAPYYRIYQCADGRFISIGPIEPQFYSLLLSLMDLKDDPDFTAQNDQKYWPAMTAKLESLFLSKPRDAWCDLLEGTDVCFAPILSLSESPQHPHMVARNSFVEIGGSQQPAPAPRFSATPSAPRQSSDTELSAALTDWTP